MDAHFRTLLLIASVSSLLSSCSPAFYSTVGQNVPLFHEKGEVALSGGIMSASNTSEGFSPLNFTPGLALQGAVAITSGAALFGSLYHMNYDGQYQINGNYCELGGGLFTYKPKSMFIGELFAGVGYGTIDNQMDAQELNAEYIKYFIQPSAGFSGRVFDVAFTPRMGVVNYLSHSTSDRADVREFFGEKKTTFVLEPGITIRGGYRNFKAQYQMNYSTFNFSQANYNEEFDPVIDCYSSLSLFIMISRHWND